LEAHVNDVLRLLLDRADTLGELDVAADEVARWPEDCLDRLLKAGLLAPTDNAQGLRCGECEEGCWVIPESSVGADGTEILTHPCDRREDIGIVRFRPEQLRMWRLDLAGLASALGSALKLGQKPKEIEPGRLWLLGKHRQPGRVHTLFFGWGYRLPDRESLATVTAGQMGALNGVLLVPHVIPVELAGPESSGPILTLTSLVEFGDDGLRLDADVLNPELGRPRRKLKVKPFTMPPGVHTWDEVTIRVLSNSKATALVGANRETRDVAEWGMADARKRTATPSATWTLLLLLASQSGELKWGDDGASANARTQMKTLRTCLRAVFGLDGDPIDEYKKTKRWQTKFALVDGRRNSPSISVINHGRSRTDGQ
jgi:hypothetical protein